MRSFVVLAVLALVTSTGDATPHKKRPGKKTPAPEKQGKQDKDKDKPATPEQQEADRHFKSGVALFKENKFAEALAEFERAYELAPHPLVLYNIAGCHRELSHYAQAVATYKRFLTEGKGVVPDARLATAQTELDGILARIARVTVTIAPVDGAELLVDGNSLGTMPLDMPLMLPPGEHKLAARAAGRRDAEKTLRLASGDDITAELVLAELPPAPIVPLAPPVRLAPPGKRTFGLGAGFGTNLLRVGDSGAPSLGFAVALGSRFELGVDGTLVAYAVIPSARIRLAGNALSVHLVGAVPVAFTDGAMSQTFVAGAVGLGIRLRPSRTIAFRIESFASYAGKTHGTTLPTFIGGEVWF
jgi:hypothetical protein